MAVLKIAVDFRARASLSAGGKKEGYFHRREKTYSSAQAPVESPATRFSRRSLSLARKSTGVYIKIPTLSFNTAEKIKNPPSQKGTRGCV